MVSKEITLKIGKIIDIVEKEPDPLRCWCLDCPKKCCLFCPRQCFKYQAIQRKCYFNIILLFYICNVISIDILNQSESAVRNSRTEVLLTYIKCQGLGSQPDSRSIHRSNVHER